MKHRINNFNGNNFINKTMMKEVRTQIDLKITFKKIDFSLINLIEIYNLRCNKILSKLLPTLQILIFLLRMFKFRIRINFKFLRKMDFGNKMGDKIV